MTYSYSCVDEEIFTGTFDSIEEAIAQAREDCCGDHSEVYIGEDGEFYPVKTSKRIRWKSRRPPMDRGRSRVTIFRDSQFERD